MNTSLWIAMLMIALCTFLMRALPLVWMTRRLKKTDTDDQVESVPEWLSVMGPTMIAAMFGTSLIPAELSMGYWIATCLGVLVTVAAWCWKRSLGIPVFAGVLAFGVCIYLIT